MKRLLPEGTKEKVTAEIIDLLSENNCTLSDFSEISQAVTSIYEDNATLSITSTNRNIDCHYRHHQQ